MSETLKTPEVRSSRRLRKILGAGAVWLAASAAIGSYGFFTDEADTSLAGYETTLSPTLDSYATLYGGAVVPSVRVDLDSLVGASVDVKQSDEPNSNPKVGGSVESIANRLGAIAAQPDGVKARVHDELMAMASENIIKGLGFGLLPLMAWSIVGERRRRELYEKLTDTSSRRKLLIGSVVMLAAASSSQAVAQPEGLPDIGWRPLSEVVPQLSAYPIADKVEVRNDIMTAASLELIQGAFETYAFSKKYYGEIEKKVPDIASLLRQPQEGETVALLVSDRHDNIGMDKVARAIGDAGGATMLFDAGDDLSSGANWEAFSLDSLGAAFDDNVYADHKWASTGNHDNTKFTSDYLKRLGFTMLDGKVVDANGATLMGVPDPRYSDYTPELREGEVTIEELAKQVADEACASETRISTLLVHDVDVGDLALLRGCVDLVLGGHDHVVKGPFKITGENGEIGYQYTNGTTGGATFSFALGKRLLREATVTLVTYKDGRPIGLQTVAVTPQQDLKVAAFYPFEYPENPTETESLRKPQTLATATP